MPAQHAVAEKEKVEKKPHVCPPSDATHPRDRWETLFAYSFITRFTDLKKKVEDFNNVMECASLAVIDNECSLTRDLLRPV